MDIFERAVSETVLIQLLIKVRLGHNFACFHETANNRNSVSNHFAKPKRNRNFVAGVVDTGEELLAGVNDTGEWRSYNFSVLKTLQKNFSPMSATPEQLPFTGVNNITKFWLRIVIDRTSQITNLSDTEPLRYRIYQILNLSDTEPIRYRIYQIRNLSDTEPIRCRTYLIPNLSDTTSIR